MGTNWLGTHLQQAMDGDHVILWSPFVACSYTQQVDPTNGDKMAKEIQVEKGSGQTSAHCVQGGKRYQKLHYRSNLKSA